MFDVLFDLLKSKGFTGTAAHRIAQHLVECVRDGNSEEERQMQMDNIQHIQQVLEKLWWAI